MRGPSAALRKHCQWIKELQEQVKDERTQAEKDSALVEERKTRMAKTFKKQRDAIQRIKEEGGHRELDPADVEAILRPAGAKPKAGGGRKPLWALTEAERDTAEDEDAALLIQFAADLDFDKYLDDNEFRECLNVVRDRAKKLQREQDAFKDALVREFNDQPEDEDGPDCGSSCGGGDAAARALRRYGGGDGDDCRPDWDGSTTCGDEKPPSERQAAQSLAAQALEGNPQLRALHSKGSVQRMVEKAQSVAASECGAA